MAYLFLLVAVGAEVVGTSLLKATDGFTRPWPSAACIAAYTLAFILLANAVKTLPVGLVYALWSGLGTAAIVAIGVTFLGETLTPALAVGIAFIIAGVVIVNLSGVA